jgi:hypothetical protein
MVLDPVEFARHDILRDPMDNVSWCPKCDEAPPCRWNRVLAALAAAEAERDRWRADYWAVHERWSLLYGQHAALEAAVEKQADRSAAKARWPGRGGRR